MKPKDDLAEVPFDSPAAGTNGTHESFDAAKPVPVARITPAEAREAMEEGAAAAKTFDNGQANRRPLESVGRTLPHSIEAEEYLLSCCLLDGNDVVQRCIDARIRTDSFYVAAHGIIFDRILRLREARKPIEAFSLAEELKSARLLDQVGGYAFITQVSSRVPTTAQVGYWIEKVREQALLREIIRSATGTVEDCYNFSGGIDEFASEQRAKLEIVTQSPTVASHAFEWDQMLAFDPKSDPDCLMGRRFLGRTGACVIVAPSGVGKSVLALQLSACAALGTPFFGMKMSHPMRVLYIQAEDDFGDVSESAQGFIKGYGPTADQMAQLKQRLRIERWNDAAGHRFIDRLAAAHRRWPFDLVTINPLFSFCGCNVSEQSELSPFLRNGINPVLNQTKSAAIVVHHTNKPPQDTRSVDKAMEAELRYMGSGSAELTNWARAYITLQGVREAGEHVHKMVFAKRGTRTGIVDDDGHGTTSVYIEHSKTGLCWLPSDFRRDPSGKFTPRFDLDAARRHYDDDRPWTDNEEAIAKALSVSSRTVRRNRRAIEN